MVKNKGGAGSLVAMRCRNCRSRKVRCGYEQPSCHQCLRSGRDCAGYSSWEVALRSDERQQNDHSIGISVSPQDIINAEEWIRESTATFEPPRHFLFQMNVSSEVWQAFDYFRLRSRNAYASRGYPTSWTVHALAASNTSPAVFYAVAALGALETSMLDMVHSSLARPALSAQMNLALRLYSAAIQHLSVSITEARQSARSLEDVIVACVVFLVFEVTRGNHFIAGRHARVGNRILDERLGLTSNEIGAPRSQVGLSLAELNYNVAFSSLEDALYHLEALMDAGHEFQARLSRDAEDLVDRNWGFLVHEKPASRFCLVNSLSRTMALSHWTHEQLRSIQRGHIQWKKTFGQLLSAQKKPSRNAIRLMLRSFVARTSMLWCRASNEHWTNAYLGEFHAAFQAAELLVQWQYSDIPVAEHLIRRLAIVEHTSRHPAESSPSGWDGHAHAAPIGPALPDLGHLPHAAGVFGHGVFQTLFGIACKCRDSVLRRRAAHLLTSSKRMEGHHSGQRLGRYANAVIALEELLTGGELPWNPQTSIDIPEAARLSDVVLHSPAGNDSVHLSCIRHPQGSSETFVLEEYRCTRVDNDNKTEQQPRLELVFAFQPSISASETTANSP